MQTTLRHTAVAKITEAIKILLNLAHKTLQLQATMNHIQTNTDALKTVVVAELDVLSKTKTRGTSFIQQD